MVEEKEIETFEKSEEAVRAETGRRFGYEVELVNRALALAWEGITLTKDRSLTYWERAYWRLTVSCFNSVRLALDALLRGYPLPAHTLARSAYEAAVTAAYVHKNRRAARFWLAKKYMLGLRQRNRTRQGLNDKRVPTLEQMLTDLRGRKGFDRRYGFLSLYAHPRAAGLLATVGPAPDGSVIYRFGGHFDAGEASAAFFNLVPIASLLVLLLLGTVARADPDWLTRAEALRQDALAWERNFRMLA